MGSVAQKLGFVLRRQTGSHAIYTRASDDRTIVIPVHKGKTLPIGTALAILRHMGIDRKEFERLS